MKAEDKTSNRHNAAAHLAKAKGLRWLFTAGLLVFTPSLLGAKGCEVGNLGSNARACGGLTGLECKSDEFCNFSEEAMCGAADATGKCESIPEACDDVYDPVCGCDDETYPNECEAHAAGVSVAKFEACEAEPGGTVCGGLQGLGCAAGEYCNTGELACAPDATGECEPKPEVCTEEYSPVCGCDGQTYSNDCFAAAAGMMVATEGECEPSGDPNVCGTRGAPECANGQFCQFELEAQCGATDIGGVCAAIPDACTKEYNPVCGCDGQTYGNACMANMAGTSVASEGECGDEPTVCEDVYEPVCGADGVTYANACEAGGANVKIAYDGECEDEPTVCPAIYAPVCGKDGKTYGNACEAGAENVAIAYEGECETNAASCGGLAGVACAEDQFCNYAPDALCGAADQTGVCQPKPEACDAIYAPVCGCDDQTYSSDCVANMAGVSVLSDGECEGDGAGAVCGGLLGASCNEGEFCDFPIEAMCGAADQTGTCRTIPEACTADYNPVCGCDDKTYGNACTANVAGVSVASKGECGGTEPSEQSCGGSLDNVCPEGTFCEIPTEAECSPEVIGVCTAIPEVCTEEYRPVCGCDGVTYGNACMARGAGTSVGSVGECQ